MKALVLGGTGAMGTPLVQILTSLDAVIYVTSRSYHVSELSNLHYLQGDAHDERFLANILNQDYDTIIDFMIYSNGEFEKRLNLLLNATKQYIFLSSCRVYAESSGPITEDHLRLLDDCTDQTYLDTDEYALAKARQENFLLSSSFRNWTIVRPYITYGRNRLQLGVLEKENWLYRALKGRSVVFSKDIAARKTTLTYGLDVASVITKLIGNKEALGQTIHITTQQSLTWDAVLNIYLDVFEEVVGKRPRVYWQDEALHQGKALGNLYQIKYDRLYDRVFDNQKANTICGELLEYTPTEDGLKECLSEFLKRQRPFNSISWKQEAYSDSLTGERTLLSEIHGWKNRCKYWVWRYVLFRF